MQSTDPNTVNNLSQSNYINARRGICRRTLRKKRELLQHLNFCRRRNSDEKQTYI